MNNNFYSTATGDLNEIARQYKDNVTATANVNLTYDKASSLCMFLV
jgi:hypothetical protein